MVNSEDFFKAQFRLCLALWPLLWISPNAPKAADKYCLPTNTHSDDVILPTHGVLLYYCSLFDARLCLI